MYLKDVKKSFVIALIAGFMRSLDVYAEVSGPLLISGTTANGEVKEQLPAELIQLADAFRQPAPDTRPGCYWYWINDNISKSGITKDLEAMARVGIGRAYIGHIFDHNVPTDTPVGDVKFMSEVWWEAVQWAVKEADRCGVEIGFFNSPGWSQSGAPWVKPAQSMRYLASSETVVSGGQKIDMTLPVPQINTFPSIDGSKPVKAGVAFTAADFQDVRVIAFRQPLTEADDSLMKRAKISAPGIKECENLFDDSSDSVVKTDNKFLDINIQFDKTEKVQSLWLVTADVSYTLECTIECSVDGVKYRRIAGHSEERGHQGPKRKDPILVPFPQTESKFFRIKLKSSKPISVSSMALSSRAVVANYVRKQLGETSPSTKPPWNCYIWESQGDAGAGTAVKSSEVIDLSKHMNSEGKLVWDAPEGQWVVLRTGMIPIGTMCAPASPESAGLEVDKMNREHVRSLFDGMVGEFLRRTPAPDRKALKYVIADSYETGPQNCTDGFIEKFEKRYGYSPSRYLPVLTGRLVDTPDISNRFLWDWRRLVAESIAYDYVGGLREICAENKLILWLENYGHWGFPSEFLLYGSQTDQVGGEFWEIGNPLGNVECRAASSCANIYGKNDVYAEAFTSGRNFTQSPADLKHWTDWVYGAGVNHFILHVYIHQPDERKPGIIQWFGTEFNRHNTWFEQSKHFIDYMRRSTVMLKAGLPVIDVAYYIGENAPAMEGQREPGLPDGYDFDYINSDVLINTASVKDGRISIKNGPSYSVLVLPKQAEMRPEVVKAIQRLVKAGATVVGPKPSVSPSLQNYPESDKEVSTCANELWGKVDGNAVKQQTYGAGRVIDGLSLKEVFGITGLLPDAEVSGADNLICAAAGSGRIGIAKKGGIVFKHRAIADSDIYFLSNTSDRAVDIKALLRQSGRQPWLCDAIQGTVRKASAFTQKEGRISIPLKLDASESVFVVLSGKIASDASGAADSNTPARKELSVLSGPWTLRFNGQGAPESVILDKLIDLSAHTNAAIRNYAGTITYETGFNLPEEPAGDSIVLDLGGVGVIAEVEINGVNIGGIWTRPWEIDVRNAVRKGENRLCVRVANTWRNRLIADAALKPSERQSYVSQEYKSGGKTQLESSGIFGPVKVWKAGGIAVK
jgi:hypothetical protein